MRGRAALGLGWQNRLCVLGVGPKLQNRVGSMNTTHVEDRARITRSRLLLAWENQRFHLANDAFIVGLADHKGPELAFARLLED